MHRRRLFAGLAVVTAYVIAVSATVALRHDHVRPLYDGFAPPTAYRFVDPPGFFASGNIEPTHASESVSLGEDGSAAAGIATPDGQFVINLGRRAIAAKRGATAARVRITPLSPRRLPTLPDGLRATGNAYRVEIAYEPRGGAVTHFTRPGTLLLEIPEIGQRVFVSSDAKSWTSVAARVIQPRQLTMTASFDVPGYYVAATNLPELAGPPKRASHAALLLGAATFALATFMFLGAYALVRRRRRGRRQPH